MIEIQKNEIFALIDKLTSVPYCCDELKAAALAWKDAAGTAEEKVASEALVKELKEDVMGVDDTIAFFRSPDAEKYFGSEVAAQKLV